MTEILSLCLSYVKTKLLSVDPGPHEQEKKTDYKIQKQTQACIKSDSVEKVQV